MTDRRAELERLAKTLGERVSQLQSSLAKLTDEDLEQLPPLERRLVKDLREALRGLGVAP